MPAIWLRLNRVKCSPFSAGGLALLSKLLSTRPDWSTICCRKGNSVFEDGARTRIRTRDQLIKSQLLYQLSYAGSDKS